MNQCWMYPLYLLPPQYPFSYQISSIIVCQWIVPEICQFLSIALSTVFLGMASWVVFSDQLFTLQSEEACDHVTLITSLPTAFGSPWFHLSQLVPFSTPLFLAPPKLTALGPGKCHNVSSRGIFKSPIPLTLKHFSENLLLLTIFYLSFKYELKHCLKEAFSAFPDSSKRKIDSPNVLFLRHSTDTLNSYN
jgi:hypothetical protein